METKHLEIEKINPAKYNPRTINDKELNGLKESIKKFGFVDPVIVNTRDNSYTLVGGHQRLKVAEMLGMETVPAVLVDLSLSEEKALNISLNNHKIQGSYDKDILASLIDEIKIDLPDLIPALNIDDLLKELLVDVAKIQDKEDVDAPTPKLVYLVEGDVIYLGDHILYCGSFVDDTSKFEELTKEKKIDFILTDPPYVLGSNSSLKGSSIFVEKYKKNNSNIEFISNFKETDFLNFIHLAMPANTNIMIFCSNKQVHVYVNHFSTNKKNHKILVWDKKTAIPRNSNYKGDVEYIVSSMFNGIFNNSIKECSYSSILNGNITYMGPHPTMKPVPLLENQILIRSHKGSYVLDPYGGSGSTLIACENQNRRCITSEILPKYCQVIVDRYIEHTKKDDVYVEINNEKIKYSDIINLRRNAAIPFTSESNNGEE